MPTVARSAALVLAAFLVSACVSVSSGKLLDASAIATIKPGQTTEADLLRIFGEPAARGLNVDGQRTMAWIYTKSKMKNPVKVDLQQQFLSVALDANGVVSKLESMDTGDKK